ncbi:non-canonical purine NTP pyrophosphatase [Candidatus Peregrinibacteria bacterium]|nr:non-canonical purine NTP pyrophosphatase [Candidatus Peregrinibacteria bacterium]
MKLLLATSNKGKIQEMREALNGCGLEILDPHDLPDVIAPHETGDTFLENAVQKARYYFERTKLPVVADDSGIIVEALKDELGIHTRRWGAGKDVSDAEWIDFFLDRMKRESNKRARFVCVLAYINEKGELHTFEGSCDGVLTGKPEAEYLPGLPLSACFRPDGSDKVFSALSVEEKNQFSHRGRALHKFKEFFQSPQGKQNI